MRVGCRFISKEKQMNRIGRFVCMAGVVFVFLVLCPLHAAFACSGCSEDSASAGKLEENNCFLCEKDINNKDKPPEVEYRGLTFRFCSEACADTFKRDPEKCFRDKACQQK